VCVCVCVRVRLCVLEFVRALLCLCEFVCVQKSFTLFVIYSIFILLILSENRKSYIFEFMTAVVSAQITLLPGLVRVQSH